MNIKIKAAAAGLVTSASLIASTMAPMAFAGTEIEISGNDRGSENSISIDFDKRVDISQNNDADFDNNVRVNASTGGNEANDNDSENVSIESGDVDSRVQIHNMANFNHADLGDCGDCHGNISAKISDNDRGSENEIDVNHSEEVNVDQDNDADFNNDVVVNASTGGNEASDNEGGDNNHQDNHNEDWDKDHFDWHLGEFKDGKQHFEQNWWDNHDDSWKAKSWWDHFIDWFNDHHDNDNNHSDSNGGHVEITTGDVLTDIFIGNHANANFLKL